MVSLHHLKPMVLIVGILAVVLGLITTFQVDEADAQGGRIRQWTRTHYDYEQVGSLWWSHNVGTCSRCEWQSQTRAQYGNFKKYKVVTHYFSDGNDTWSTEASREYLGIVERLVSSIQYCMPWCPRYGG